MDMQITTRQFKIDGSVTVKAYFYQFKNHIEQLDLVRKNSRGVFDRSLSEVLPAPMARNLIKAAEYLIKDSRAVSVETIDGLTLSRI